MAACRISLNVIVYNEEARLEQCLLDARPHVDEIVVVDQMSTDATPEIAQRLADVFIRDVHHGHAEPSRELAASRSSGDWILVLDADETMSDLLKSRIRELIEGDADGYWIRKSNTVDGVETSTVLHLRLVRASRAAFDPRPHGGATVVTGNVATFDEIGILHPKTEAEQLYDDERYEQIAAEEHAPSSAKRNWLQHNRTLRAHRDRAGRDDLASLLPTGAATVLVLGDLQLDVPAGDVVRVADAGELAARPSDERFDAAVVALGTEDRAGTLLAARGRLQPGGSLIGTVPAARNLRRVEAVVAAVVSDDGALALPPEPGCTRRGLAGELEAAGLDLRWMRLVRDGWLDAVSARPDGSGAIVESKDFFLRSVSAEVAEELTATEIVFVAALDVDHEPPCCSVVLAAIGDDDGTCFAEALQATAPRSSYELVVVGAGGVTGPSGVTHVQVAADASLAARWNAGARVATGELLVFVSGSTMPLPGWLDRLVDAARSRPDVGAAGSKVVAPDGTVEHAGLVLGRDAIPYRIHQGAASSDARVNRTRIVPAVAGDGMITSRAELVQMGGFDEGLGVDLAEADLCMRLRARGRVILYSSTAVLRAGIRSLPGERGRFRRSVREFGARWSTASSSDQILCRSDGVVDSDEWNRSWRLPRPSAPATGGLPAIAWSSHFYEQGGYMEEAVAAVEALDDAGICVVANPVTYDRRSPPRPSHLAQRLAALVDRDLPDDFVHVAHIGANRFKLHPGAMRNVGRTMFETDGLPPGWAAQCNLMDEVWVPCEHNLRSFTRAGVHASKLHLVPETFDAALFDPAVAPMSVEGLDGFVFLSVFSWLGRKAWDVLLQAWYDEFDAQDDVTLLLKTDPQLAPAGTDCRREVDAFVRSQLGHDPRRGPRVVVLDQLVDTAEMPALYRAADAFVLASHGEGWGRPYMEAMAMGLPTIATRWSGNLEFMDDDNSCLVDYELVDAPGDGWMRGQRWAQPSVRDLRRAMRRLVDHPDDAAAMGARARADVLVSCRPELVADAVRERLEAIDRHPVHVPVAHVVEGPTAPVRSRRVPPASRHVSACVLVRDGEALLGESLASLGDAADTIDVIEAGPGDDATSRNEALERIRSGWVLVLDAGQTLDPSSREIVRELVQRGGAVGYTAQLRRQFGVEGAVSTIDRRAAVLFPAHPDLRYVGAVREELVARGSDLRFRLVTSPLVVHEHRHRADGDARATAPQELAALERAVRHEPDEPFHRYNLARALLEFGLHAEAEARLRDAIGAAPPRASWLPAAYVTLARAVAAHERAAEAVKLCKTATKRAPDWAAGWCALGQALLDTGRADKALTAYERALECSGDTIVAVDVPDDVSWSVTAAMARVQFALGNHREASAALERALTVRPDHGELRVLLARAYEALGWTAGSRRELELAMARRTGPEAYARLGDHFTDVAQTALLRGLAEHPEDRALRARIEALRAAGAMS